MKAVFLIIILFLSSLLFAQRYEIGLFLGGANTIADVGNETYLAPNHIAIGGMLKRNLNERYAIRLNGTFGVLRMNDAQAHSAHRKDRGLERRNYVGEGALIFEFNFFDFNGKHQRAQTPYLFAGIGGFFYQKEDLTIDLTSNGLINTRSRKGYDFVPTIPFGFGYRYKFNYNWVIGAEIGFRTTFTDNLDKGDPSILFNTDSNTLNSNEINRIKEEIENVYKIGNLNSNDWYVFTGITLSYTFGRAPCYCK